MMVFFVPPSQSGLIDGKQDQVGVFHQGLELEEPSLCLVVVPDNQLPLRGVMIPLARVWLAVC